MPEAGASPGVLLDACCVINLFASRRIEAILRSIPATFAVADAVAKEALFVRVGSTEHADQREQVALQPLIDRGFIRRLVLESDDELDSFIRFASQLDDGEAMTCSLALHRGYAIATDDRKALRVIRALNPPIQSFTTSELLKAWVDAKQPPDSIVTQVLVAISEGARFVPARHDPLFSWWQGLLEGR